MRIAQVSFSDEPLDEDVESVLAVLPEVDGKSLASLVELFEEQQRFTPIGGYGGLVPSLFSFGPLDRYFLGEFEPDGYWAQLGGIYLLGCECGEVGCWPLQCRVTRGNDTVAWESFSQPHRPERDYSRFGPFVFDADQYLAAIGSLRSDIDGLSAKAIQQDL